MRIARALTSKGSQERGSGCADIGLCGIPDHDQRGQEKGGKTGKEKHGCYSDDMNPATGYAITFDDIAHLLPDSIPKHVYHSAWKSAVLVLAPPAYSLGDLFAYAVRC